MWQFCHPLDHEQRVQVVQKMKGRVANSSRLGGGEFQQIRGFNAARQESGLVHDGPTKERLEKEALFLHAVFEAEPEARASLEKIASSLPKLLEGNDLPPVPEQELREWCGLWNLNAPWCLDAARQFVWVFWLQARLDGERFSFEALRSRSSAEETATQPFRDQHLSIDFGSWPVTQRTRKEFEEECESLLKQKLKTFCDRIEQQAQAGGMERTREKREFDHFYWLARRLVHGESAAYMKNFTAGLENISVRAINKAVNELARDLELNLGRPRANIIRQAVTRSVAFTGKRRKRKRYQRCSAIQRQ